jgi:Tol biopolymer transport system component
MFVRWSHDGRWFYFASGHGTQFQLFRQSAAGGRPEQITAGTGLAVRGAVTSFALAPDGRSVVYPSGEGQETLWVKTQDQAPRQLTFEGNAFDPHPSLDGERVFYIAGPRFTVGQIWARTVDGSRSEQICPGFGKPSPWFRVLTGGASYSYIRTSTARPICGSEL